MNKFFGTGIAMVTPFNSDGSIDYNGLKNLIDHLIEGGVEYLVSQGTTGEAAVLDKDEQKAVFEFTAEAAAGRVPLIAGIGGNNTRSITAALEKFDIKGYEAVLSVSPYYNRPPQEGIYQHYKAVAKASPLPVILYNVPARTGSNMEASTTIRLANEVENIIGVKEASGSFDQFSRILRDKPEDFLFISGDDPVTLPLVSMGAAGIISVVGNAFPQLLSDMVRLCLAGKFKEAQPLHFKLLEITRLCFAEGNPCGIKEVLKHLDICGNTLRLPLVNVSPALSEKIREEIGRLS